MDATPFSDLQKARQEMTDLKNDFKQFGRELANSAEQKVEVSNASAPSSDDSDAAVKDANSSRGSEADETKSHVSDVVNEWSLGVDSGDTPDNSVINGDTTSTKP